MRPFDRLGVCRVKWIGWDKGPGLHLTLLLSFVIWCPKNPSMHLERLQCARPLAAMGLSARAIQTSIETVSSSGTEDEDPTTSRYWFWRFNLAPPCRLQLVSHGKSASKLERMKHIPRTHEQFPYLMAALQMKASCIVQSFTNAGQKHQKIKGSTLIFTNSARCLHMSTFLRPILGIICHEPRLDVEHVADGVEQCIALLFTIVYCSEPTKRYWDTVCLRPWVLELHQEFL